MTTAWTATFLWIFGYGKSPVEKIEQATTRAMTLNQKVQGLVFCAAADPLLFLAAANGLGRSIQRVKLPRSQGQAPSRFGNFLVEKLFIATNDVTEP